MLLRALWRALGSRARWPSQELAKGAGRADWFGASRLRLYPICRVGSGFPPFFCIASESDRLPKQNSVKNKLITSS